MKNGKMINLSDYPIFKNNWDTLKETSKDKRDKYQITYMTELEIHVINFDKVKTEYLNGLGKSEEAAKSVDAIGATDGPDGHITLIEFKNGKVEPRDVKTKIKDSLLIILDKCNKTISFSRENFDFILVYNEDPKTGDNIAKVEDDHSKRYIRQHVFRKAGEFEIKFGLGLYEGVYVRKIYTLTKDEFHNFLLKTPLIDLKFS